MNTETSFEPEIDLRDLFLHVLIHWRIILIVMILGSLLGGAYSWYKGHHETAASREATSEEIISEEKQLFSDAKEAIAYDISYYQKVLAAEKEYMENSLYMQLDPSNVASTSVVFALRFTEPQKEEYADLILLGEAAERAVYDEAFLIQEAERFGTEPQYIRELISRTKIDKIPSITGTIGEQDVEYFDQMVYAFRVSASGQDTVFTSAIINDLIQFLQSYASDQLTVSTPGLIGHFVLETGQPTSSISVDTNVNTGQFNYRTNIYNDIYRLGQIFNSKDTVSKNEPHAEVVKQSTGISKKYLLLGLLGGLLLVILIIILRYLFGGKLNSAAYVQSHVGIRVLGILPDETKTKRGRTRLDRFIQKRIIGPSFAISENDALEMMVSQIQILEDGGLRTLFTCTQENERVKRIAEYLRDRIAKGDLVNCVKYCPEFLRNAEAHFTLQNSDGVILVESQDNSSMREAEDVIEKVQSLGKKILGIVLV